MPTASGSKDASSGWNRCRRDRRMTARPIALQPVYIEGNEFTDGSVRLIVIEGVAELQEREDGIWIPSELRLDASTLFLGNDVSIRGIGSHLLITSNEANRTSLLLEVEFDDAGTALPHGHVLGPLFERVVFVPNETGEVITSLFELAVTSFLTAFRYNYYFKSGSVAATQPVTLTLTKGSTPGGALVFTKTMPASQWPANTEVVVELDGALSLSVGAPLLLTISSAANFSLVGDGTVTGTFFAMDFQAFSLEDVIAIPTGTDRFMFNNVGQMTIDNDGHPIMSGGQGTLSTTTPPPPFPPLSDPPPPGI